MYQAAYTAESLAAQIKAPQDRLEVAGRPVTEAVGGKLLAGGFRFGEYDVTIVYEAPDDVSAAAVALAAGAGGGDQGVPDDEAAQRGRVGRGAAQGRGGGRRLPPPR